jgi:phosphatidylglycerophosphate synthase
MAGISIAARAAWPTATTAKTAPETATYRLAIVSSVCLWALSPGQAPESAIRLTLANALTYLRLGSIPVLLLLAALDLRGAFLWLLALAWLTDAIDGPLARAMGQESARGARLDSVADRGLMLVIPLAVAWMWPQILKREAVWVAMLGIALVVPRLHAFLKFRRLPSYHTWLAKALAVYMSLALLLMMLGDSPWPFRIGAVLVLLEAAEEIAITRTLDRWRADIPSWWHLRRKRASGN